jgi:hypothetical protein
MAAAIACAMAAVLVPARADDLTPAELMYSNALEAMSAVQQPPFVTYRAVVSAGRTSLKVVELPDGHAKPMFQQSDYPFGQSSWLVAYRNADERAAIDLGNDERAVSTQAIFNPTWAGAYAWVRHGLISTIDATPPPPNAEPTETPQETMPTIAIVSVLGTAYYRVEDRGPSRCDGRPAHALHLIAWRDADKHPLTDVVIDRATGRFCDVRISFEGGDYELSMYGSVLLHFADVQSFYLVTTATFDIVVRHEGLYLNRGRVDVRYEDERVPTALPRTEFIPLGV